MKRKISLMIALLLCGVLAVQAKTSLKVAYAVKSEAQGTDTIFQTLSRNFDSVYVHVQSGAWVAADVTTLEAYDVIVAPSYFDGGNLGLARSLNKPLLFMHGGIPVTSYVAPGGSTARWGWVPSMNHNEGVGYEYGALNQLAVVLENAGDKDAGIYKGLKFVDNSVRILNDLAVSGDGFQGLMATAQPRTLANAAAIYPAPATGIKYVIYYQPQGNAPDGSTVLKKDYCYIGIHSNSLNRLNQNGKQLIVNTVQKLAGLVPTGTEELGASTPSCGSIGLNKTTLSMLVSNVEQLSAKQNDLAGEADNVIKWTSSDPTVATVDYLGTVRAQATGSANIIASVAGGTVTATCAVTVSAGASLLLSETFADWELRNNKMGTGLTPNDSAPNQGPQMCDTFTVRRNLIGGGTVDFELYNVAVAPHIGTKYGNDAMGCLAIGKTGTVKTTPPATDAGYNPKQGNDGTAVAAQGTVTNSYVIIGKITNKVQVVELTVSVEGGNRGGNIQKSYDGVTWMNVDAVQDGTPGIVGKLVPTNCLATTFSIVFPKPEIDFYLRIGPGGNGGDASMKGNQTFRLHGLKFFAPATAAQTLTKVSISGERTRTIYAPGEYSSRKDSIYLSYTYTPALAQNALVEWTSTNPAAATVDASTGMVVGVAAGSTKIVAKSKDGSDVSDTIEVQVDAQVDVQSVAINAPAQEIHALEVYQLSATVLPAHADNPAVVYSSLYPAIATVTADGLLTANMKGWAAIVVASMDGTNVQDTLDIRILPAIYLGGEPKPDEGAPKLPVLFDARTALSPTQKSGEALDENWAKGKWFDFATTGLRKEITNDSVHNMNYTRMQGVYINDIVENESTADFANIGIKTTMAAGRQTRLVFAFDGELDSLKVGIVVTGSTFPSTVAVQESNDAQSWNDVHYIVNATAVTAESEAPSLLTKLAENVYTYPVIKGFNKNSRFIRLFQLESGAASGTSHNIYFDGIWMYGVAEADSSGTTGISKGSSTADYGISVYPNPTSNMLYLDGGKAMSKAVFVNLQSGQVVKRLTLDGAASSSVSLDNLAGGAYLVVIYVEGSSVPQVVKVTKQ